MCRAWGAVVPNLYSHPGDADEGAAPTIVMRGVVENDASYAREPAVGLYIDDVYHSTVVGAAINLADIDHVEVKRGPQGTLEGNASIGGSISIFSKTPKGDNTGYVEATYGSFHKMQLDAAFDTTIAPNLFMRVSGSLEHQDGLREPPRLHLPDEQARHARARRHLSTESAGLVSAWL